MSFINVFLMFYISFLFVQTISCFNNVLVKREVKYSYTMHAPTIKTDLQLEYNLLKFLRVDCPIDNVKPGFIVWYLCRNIEIKHSYNDTCRIIKSASSQLEITNDNELMLLPSYYCSGSNMLGVVLSRKFFLNKVFPQPTELKYRTEPTPLKSKAIVRCQVYPDIFSKYFVLKYWVIHYANRRSYKLYKTNNKFSIINSTSHPQLHIRHVDFDDFRDLQVRCVLQNRYYTNLVDNSSQWQRLLQSKSDDSSWNPHVQRPYSINQCDKETFLFDIGSQVELPWCSNSPTDDLSWYHYSPSSKQTTRIIVTEGNSFYSYPSGQFGNLIIRKVTVKQEGQYFVGSKSIKQSNNQDATRFTLEVRQSLSVSLINNTAVIYNRALSLSCMMRGYPQSTVKWYHNGKLFHVESLLDTKEHSIIRDFVIDRVNTSTSGVYQCFVEMYDKAGNLVDNAQDDFSVVIAAMPPYLINQKPPIDPSLSSYYSILQLSSSTQSISFSCEFAAIPSASITWYLDNTRIPIDSVIYAENTLHTPYNIKSKITVNLNKLSNIDKQWTYGGEYRAEAVNSHGKAECRVLVRIENVLHIRDTHQKVFNRGENMKLHCNVISGSRPEIKWFMIQDSDTQIRLPQSHKEEESADKRTLTIVKATNHDDEGRYRCCASLSTNGQICHDFVVDIVSRPKVTNHLPGGVTINTKRDEHISYLCAPDDFTDKPWFAWWTLSKTNQSLVEILQPNTNQGQVWKISYKNQLDNTKSDELKIPSDLPEFLKSYPNRPVKLWISFDPSLDKSKITCVIQNNVGIDKKDIVLRIYRPGFKKPPPSTYPVVLGNNLSIDCVPDAASFPVKTQWQYQNEGQVVKIPIVRTQPISERIYQLVNGTLIVHNITESDPLQFTCQANISDPVAVFGKITTINILVPARIVLFHDSYDLRRHRNANVTCSVHGDNKNISMKLHRFINDEWHEIDSREIYHNSDLHSKIHNISLIINTVPIDRAGLYKCTAINNYNTHRVEKITNISVVDLPGGVLEIISREVGSTHIHLSWKPPRYNGNKPIIDYLVIATPNTTSPRPAPNSAQSIADQVVTKTTAATVFNLTGLHPATNYNISISARNSVGQGKSSGKSDIVTKEAAPKGKVRELQCSNLSSTSVTLTWTIPAPHLQNGHITGYEICFVDYTGASSDIWNDKNKIKCPETHLPSITSNQQQDQNQLQSNIYIDLLNKFTNYQFRVRPINSRGYGPPAFLLVRTQADLPSRPAILLGCNAESHDAIEVEWNPPPKSSINGILQQYQINYYPIIVYPSYQDQQLKSISVNQTKTILFKLQPYTNYSIQVMTRNQVGLGPPSPPIFCRTTGKAPSPPPVAKAISHDGSIVVIWLASEHTNGEITSYTIMTLPNRQTINIDSITHKSQATYAHSISDSISNVNKIAIRANNQVDSSQPIIIPVERSTTRKIISLPRNISVDSQSKLVLDCALLDSQLSIVYWSDKLTGTKLSVKSSAGKYYLAANNSLIITDVSKQHQTTFRCTRTRDDFIDYQVKVNLISNGVPNKPEIVYYNASQHYIYLSWRAVSTNPHRIRDPINAFDIDIHAQSNPSIQYKLNLPAHQFSMNISQLPCGLNFTVELTAINSIGTSQADVIYVTTLGNKPLLPVNMSVLSYEHSLCFPLLAFEPGEGCPAYKYNIKTSPTAYSGQLKFDKKYSNNINVTSSQLATDSKCYNVSGLQVNTSYNYRIIATNHAGSTTNMGQAQTKPLALVTNGNQNGLFLNNNRQHNKPNFFEQYKWVIIIGGSILIGVIIVCIFLGLLAKRKNQHNSRSQQNNNFSKAHSLRLLNNLSPGPLNSLTNHSDNNQKTLTSGDKKPTGFLHSNSSNNNSGNNTLKPIPKRNFDLPPLPVNEPDNNQSIGDENDRMEPYATYVPLAEHHPPRYHMSSGITSTSGPMFNTVLPLIMGGNSTGSKVGPSSSTATVIRRNTSQGGRVSPGVGQVSMDTYMSDNASQAHSYQYPEVNPQPSSAQHQQQTAQSPSASAALQHRNMMMHGAGSRYARGYSTGNEQQHGASSNLGMRSQIDMDHLNNNNTIGTDSSMNTDYPRPDSSTESSAKDELSMIMTPNIFPSRFSHHPHLLQHSQMPFANINSSNNSGSLLCNNSTITSNRLPSNSLSEVGSHGFTPVVNFTSNIQQSSELIRPQGRLPNTSIPGQNTGGQLLSHFHRINDIGEEDNGGLGGITSSSAATSATITTVGGPNTPSSNTNDSEDNAHTYTNNFVLV